MRAKLIFLILDVHYQTDVVQKLDSAKVAGIRFQGIETNEIFSEHTVNVNNVAPYQSGQFYKRELPCLLALIKFLSSLDEISDLSLIKDTWINSKTCSFWRIAKSTSWFW